MKFIRGVLAGLLALAMGSAEATLIDRGGGLIYDNVLNITWLQDTNYSKTSGYDADGRMTWNAAETWAENLVYHDSVRNVDLTGWRLPTMTDPANTMCNFSYDGTNCGYNSTGSEMADLYYVTLGNTSRYTTDGVLADCTQSPVGCFRNQGPFTNNRGGDYWSGTPYVGGPTYLAWFFSVGTGGQSAFNQSFEVNAWAVRDGDVTTVPEPTTLALLGIALAGLGATRRRKQNATAGDQS